MNKSELIRRTARIAGAPDADASLFFEIFIRSAADILNPGDVIQIKDMGFLHYKIAKPNAGERIKNLKAVFPGSGWIDLIIYSDSYEKIPSGDPLFFVVPAKYELDFAEIDAPFSLSVNKPVIQQTQKKEAYFIPQSYNELVRLLESKAARLLVNAKVIKSENKENEVFIPGTASAEEQTIAFEKPESAPQPEGKNLPEIEKGVIPPETAEEAFNESNEPEVELPPEQKNKEEIPDLTEEDKKESDIPSGIAHVEEQLEDHEQNIEQVSGEAGTEKPKTATPSQEDNNKEEKGPSEEREIDKLLSKGAFGSNIPWKFDEISVIEPGRREESQEENAAEEFPEDQSIDQPEELTDAEPAGEKLEGTAAADLTADEGEKETAQTEIEKTESVNPEIFDANLTIGASKQDNISDTDTIGTSEDEKAVEEAGMEPESGKEFQNSAESTQPEQVIDETSGEIKSQEPAHEEETPVEMKNFSDTEYNEGMIPTEDIYVGSEKKNIEPEAEETQEQPEDKDYEDIKPVKLKYDWKEGYLKDSEEPPISEKIEPEEKEEEAETPDEEGYIEIKPPVSKEKIDFLADSDEEELQEPIKENITSEEDRTQKDLKEYISKIEEIDKQTSHKRRNTTILAIIIFLLFVGIGVILYYQYIFKKGSLTPVKSMTVVVKNAKTINRDFEMPVTYPYSKNENKGSLYTQPIDSLIIAASHVSPNKVTIPPGSKTQNTVTPQEPPKLENLGDYIFRQGNEYIVQIASFETQIRAEAQVGSLKKANYDSYVRVDKRPDGVIYYAVMIRGFKSYDEAKNFLK